MLARSEISMVTKIEALLRQELLYPVNVVNYILWKHHIALNVLIKRNEFYSAHQIDVVSIWHLRNELSFCNDYYKYVAFYV